MSEGADANADALTSCAPISVVGMQNSDANTISHFISFRSRPSLLHPMSAAAFCVAYTWKFLYR